MDLYNLLNVEKQATKTTTSNNTSIESVIKKRINEVIHNVLLEEYPQYYKNIDSTTIVKASDGKLDSLKDINGYKLLIPMDDKIDIENGKSKVTLANPVRVANPTIYLQGIKNNLCEYVKIGGKTTIWNKKKSDFTEK